MKKVSFDFDGTLEDDFDGTLNNQKQEIQKIAKDYISKGYDVYIITKRYDALNYKEGKGYEHHMVYDIAKKLGIYSVYFTNREMKSSKIIELGIDIHFEDSDYEVNLINKACEESGHKCVIVPVEDPYWRDLVY